MARYEIVMPETKPETEWVRGRALQKVSPTYDHAALQTLLAMALREWADERAYGRIGTEWRFRLAPPHAVVRPLVPDVAFLSYAELPADAHDGTTRVWRANETLTHDALPGFALDVAALFARAKR
jgi:Uma2 family endonuclease